MTRVFQGELSGLRSCERVPLYAVWLGSVQEAIVAGHTVLFTPATTLVAQLAKALFLPRARRPRFNPQTPEKGNRNGGQILPTQRGQFRMSLDTLVSGFRSECRPA